MPMNAKPRVIPFRIGGPIQDPADFAGRKDVLQAVSNAMLNLQNVSLHGERRTGKTSLLLYLAHPTMSSIIGLPETHIPVYFNFQDFSEARAANVWQAMADAIAEQIEQRHPDGEAESECFLGAIAEFLDSPEVPELFGTGFGRAFAALDDSGVKLHLLFDEFDQTARNPNLGDPFYDALRSLPTRAENISYVIATRTGLTALQPTSSKVSSPLFNIFTQVILSPFREDEVYRLIFDYFARAELDISLADKLCEELPFLYEVTGYHPFFLQTLCYHLCTMLDEPDWPLGRARQEALRAFEKDAKPHFEYYWEVSSKKEQGLIKRLASQWPIDWDQIEAKALVESLRDRCLVIQTGEPERKWRLFSSAFSNWVNSRQTGIELILPGETIFNGQYTIEKHLGTGGQGQIYLARHRIFGQVAIKRVHPHIADRSEGRARFERELRITDQLRDEHVIFIRNFDRDPARDEWFSVMEYTNDGSLEDKLNAEAPLSITEAVDIAITLCRALAHIHRYPYVHGDLKPSNILFHIPLTGTRILKLSDFGSAFQPVQAGVLPLPSGLKAARTVLYVSPELLDASDPEDTNALEVSVDQRVDIYAVGVILYEMLTGRPPFWQPSGESEDVIVRLEQQHVLFQKVKYQIPPEPKIQRREILPALNDLVMKALAKDPADRFASVDEMRASLEKASQEEEARLAELAHLRPLADQAFKEERWGHASDFLYRILDLAPDDPDALQKLNIARDQQQLVYLQHDILRKMNEGLWQEAKELIEEALKIAPGDATLAAWQAKTEDQLTILGILEQAKKAEKKADWRKVVNFCLEALRLDPSHAGASSLLSRAQTWYKIATLRQETEALRRQGDKQGELRKLKEFQEVAPADNEVESRIEALQRAIALETYYAQGKQAYDERRWQEAVEAMEKVLAIDSFYRQDDHSAALLKADAEKKLVQEEVETFRTLPKEEIQQQLEKHLLPRPMPFLISIDVKAVPKKIWSLITHNVTLAIISILIAAGACVAAVLAVPGVLKMFEAPRINRVAIFLNGDQIAEPSIEGDQPISLNELPILIGGQSVNLNVVVVDENSTIYSGNDLKCRWSVAPIDDESQVINTEACVALYMPSRNYSRQTVAIEVEGAEQRFKSVPLISMQFEIVNK